MKDLEVANVFPLGLGRELDSAKLDITWSHDQHFSLLLVLQCARRHTEDAVVDLA